MTAVLHAHCKQRLSIGGGLPLGLPVPVLSIGGGLPLGLLVPVLSIGGGLPLGLLVPVLGNEVSCVDHHPQTFSVSQQHHLTDNDRERDEREEREVREERGEREVREVREVMFVHTCDGFQTLFQVLPVGNNVQ